MEKPNGNNDASIPKKNAFKNRNMDNFILEQNKIDRKCKYRSFISRLHQERRDAEKEASCTMAKQSQGWRTEEVKQEDLLAQEMAKDKFQNCKELKLRELLRNSEELRDLEQKLRNAYIQRDLTAQLAEKKAAELRKKCFEKEEQKIILKNEKLCTEIERKQKEEAETIKSKYREELQDQMIDKQKLRELEYKNLLEEKALIDGSLKTILEEDQREQARKLQMKKKTAEDNDLMLIAKKKWVLREKHFQEEEDKKIRVYLAEKEKIEKKLQIENKKREEFKTQARVECAKMVLSHESERFERDRIAQILMDEDSRLKEEEKIQRDLEKKLKTAIEFKEITAKQIEHRLQSIQEEKEEEIQFSRKVLEENQKAIMCEKAIGHKKKLQNYEYGLQLKCLMEQQQIERLKDLERTYQEEQLMLENQKESRRIINEERVRLLKEHVANLVGFVPKGTIQREDLPHLGSEIQNFYSSNVVNKTQ